MADSKSVHTFNTSTEDTPIDASHVKLPLSKRILAIVWDSLDKSPSERAFIAKVDCE